MKIELKKDWKRKGLKSVPKGTVINIDDALYAKLEKKGLFEAAKKKTENKSEN